MLIVDVLSVKARAACVLLSLRMLSGSCQNDPAVVAPGHMRDLKDAFCREAMTCWCLRGNDPYKAL